MHRFPPVALLLAAGGAGPGLAAVLLILRSADQEQQRDYWRRLLDLRRIGMSWHGVILLAFPLLNLLAILVSVLAGEPGPHRSCQVLSALLAPRRHRGGRRPLGPGRTEPSARWHRARGSGVTPLSGGEAGARP